MKRGLLLLIISILSTPTFCLAQETSMASGDASREFLMSCTYGTLAGTLIGAASLAFVDRPSDNLNKVARGASIGLYAGILLGAYVVYVLPGMEDDPYDDPRVSNDFMLFPIVSEQGVDGAQAQFNLYSF